MIERTPKKRISFNSIGRCTILFLMAAMHCDSIGRCIILFFNCGDALRLCSMACENCKLKKQSFLLVKNMDLKYLSLILTFNNYSKLSQKMRTSIAHEKINFIMCMLRTCPKLFTHQSGISDDRRFTIFLFTFHNFSQNFF